EEDAVEHPSARIGIPGRNVEDVHGIPVADGERSVARGTNSSRRTRSRLAKPTIKIALVVMYAAFMATIAPPTAKRGTRTKKPSEVTSNPDSEAIRFLR